MKKINLILIMLLLSLLLVSCDESDDKNDNLIHGFESYEAARDYTYEGWFGKVDINFDEKYISEGNASFKVYPMGNYIDMPTNYPFVKINSFGKDVLTSDYSEFKSILLDVYNPNDKDLTIGINLEIMADTITATDIQYYTIKANSWNICEYDISNGGVKYAFNQLSDVYSVAITFCDIRENLESLGYPVYLDNLRGVKGETAAINLKKDSNGTFLSFENEYEKDLLDYFFMEKYATYMFDASINVDKRYVTYGDRSLKMSLRPDFMTYSNNLGITLYQQVFSKCLKDGNTLSIDVYNDCITVQTITLTCKVGNVTTTVTEKLQPKTMTTVSIVVDDISLVTKIMVQFPTEYAVSNHNQAKVFYLDNFRITKTEE